MNLVQLSSVTAELLGAAVAACFAAVLFYSIGGSIGVVIFTGFILSANIFHGNVYNLEQSLGYGYFLAAFILAPGILGRYLLIRKNLDARISIICSLCVLGVVAWPMYYFLEIEQWVLFQVPVNAAFATYSLLHRGIFHFPVRWLFSKKYRNRD